MLMTRVRPKTIMKEMSAKYVLDTSYTPGQTFTVVSLLKAYTLAEPDEDDGVIGVIQLLKRL